MGLSSATVRNAGAAAALKPVLCARSIHARAAGVMSGDPTAPAPAAGIRRKTERRRLGHRLLRERLQARAAPRPTGSQQLHRQSGVALRAVHTREDAVGMPSMKSVSGSGCLCTVPAAAAAYGARARCFFPCPLTTAVLLWSVQWTHDPMHASKNVELCGHAV